MVDERLCREVNCARYIFAFKAVFWNSAVRICRREDFGRFGLFGESIFFRKIYEK